MDDGHEQIRLIPQTMGGCWILNKLWRRRVKRCQRVMATLRCQLSKCEHYYCVFPQPTLTQLLMAPTTTWATESPLYSWADWRSCSLWVAAACHDTGKSAYPVSLLMSQTIRVYQQSTPRGHTDDVCSMESVMCHTQEEPFWIQLADNCTPTPTVQLFLWPDHRVTLTLVHVFKQPDTSNKWTVSSVSCQ